MTFLVRCWRCDVVRWSDHQGLDLRSAVRAVRQRQAAVVRPVNCAAFNACALLATASLGAW
jgi:hypothetical protein